MKDSNNYCLFQIFLVSLIVFDLTQSNRNKDYVVKHIWEFESAPACGIGQSEDNYDSYITPQFRYSVCSDIFDQSVTDLECYEDYKLGNPCWINCYQNTTGKNDKSACSKRLLEDDKRLRLIGSQCGQSFYCNEYGCCDEKKSTTTTTPSTTTPTPSTTTTTPSTTTTTPSTTTTTPSTTTTTPSTTITTPSTTTTTPSTTTTTPSTTTTTPSTTTTTPSTTTTTPSTITTTSTEATLFPPPQCHSLGNISSSRGQSSYWNCYFAVEEVLECKENEIFDDFNQICQTDWKRYIQCESEGFFANPFDCHKFYRCYHNPPDSKELKMGFYTCRKDEYDGHLMVWNNEKLTCVRQNDTELCNNLDLPDHKLSTSTSNPSDVEVWGGADIDNDIEFRKIYYQNIYCQSQGLFRNPFDCHKFYKCYYSVSDKSSTGDILYDLEFYVCRNRLSVFDEKTGECVHHDKTDRCDNKQVPKIERTYASENRYNYEINSKFY